MEKIKRIFLLLARYIKRFIAASMIARMMSFGMQPKPIPFVPRMSQSGEPLDETMLHESSSHYLAYDYATFAKMTSFEVSRKKSLLQIGPFISNQEGE